MAWIICKYGSGGGGGGDRPDGSTVTPVSDVPTWLRCGGLGSKGYTTLSQILSDANTLNGLMSDANAVNYLVRSTSWVSDITGNQSAMTYIGANDYAAYKLLSNSTWRTAICNSTYFESVLNVKVPTMTSNTTPEGLCAYSNAYPNSYWNVAYKVFDGDTSSNGWLPPQNSTNEYIYYKFKDSECLVMMQITFAFGSSPISPVQFDVIGSNDGVNWVDIASGESISGSGTVNVQKYYPVSTSYKYLGVRNTNIWIDTNGAHYTGLMGLQFYGRIFGNIQSWLKAGKVDKNYTTLEQVLADSSTLQTLMASSDAVDYLSACGNWADTICANQSAMNYIGLNNYAANTLLADACWCNAIANSAYIESVLNVKVPVMTSNTEPSGEVIYTSTSGTDYPWRAFNPSIKSGRYVNANAEGYIGYIFPNPTKVFVADLHIHSGYYHKEMKLQTSSDGGNWIDCTDYINCPINSNVKITNNKSTLNRYWRVYGRYPQGGHPYVYMSFMNFYGRQDV